MFQNMSWAAVCAFSLSLAACDQQLAAQQNAEGLHGEDCESGCPHAKEAAVSAERFSVNLAGAPSLGPENAAITMVVFSDFECPFCNKGADRLKVLQAKYGANLRIAFKQRPLPFHKNARLAAKASIAAANQGKFWEYHDTLFEDQSKLNRDGLISVAKDLGLDADRFAKDLDAPETDAKVKADEAEADKLDVRGTPTFFVNGRMITGAQPIEKFEEVIKEELATRR